MTGFLRGVLRKGELEADRAANAHAYARVRIAHEESVKGQYL